MASAISSAISSTPVTREEPNEQDAAIEELSQSLHNSSIVDEATQSAAREMPRFNPRSRTATVSARDKKSMFTLGKKDDP